MAEEAKAAAPAQTEKVEHVAKRGKFVRYVPYGERKIAASDFESVGAKAPDSHWGKHNARRLPADQFDDAAINYLVNVDGNFTLEDGA